MTEELMSRQLQGDPNGQYRLKMTKRVGNRIQEVDLVKPSEAEEAEMILAGLENIPAVGGNGFAKFCASQTGGPQAATTVAPTDTERTGFAQFADRMSESEPVDAPPGFGAGEGVDPSQSPERRREPANDGGLSVAGADRELYPHEPEDLNRNKFGKGESSDSATSTASTVHEELIEKPSPRQRRQEQPVDDNKIEMAAHLLGIDPIQLKAVMGGRKTADDAAPQWTTEPVDMSDVRGRGIDREKQTDEPQERDVPSPENEKPQPIENLFDDKGSWPTPGFSQDYPLESPKNTKIMGQLLKVSLVDGRVLIGRIASRDTLNIQFAGRVAGTRSDATFSFPINDVRHTEVYRERMAERQQVNSLTSAYAAFKKSSQKEGGRGPFVGKAAPKRTAGLNEMMDDLTEQMKDPIIKRLYEISPANGAPLYFDDFQQVATELGVSPEEVETKYRASLQQSLDAFRSPGRQASVKKTAGKIGRIDSNPPLYIAGWENDSRNSGDEFFTKNIDEAVELDPEMQDDFLVWHDGTYGEKGTLIDKPVRTADKVPGGLADGMPDSAFDPAELALGIPEEMREHTNDPEIAKEIVEDHLVEDPKRYEKETTAGEGTPGFDVNLSETLKMIQNGFDTRVDMETLDDLMAQGLVEFSPGVESTFEPGRYFLTPEGETALSKAASRRTGMKKTAGFEVIEWPRAGSGQWWVVKNSGTPERPQYLPIKQFNSQQEGDAWLAENPTPDTTVTAAMGKEDATSMKDTGTDEFYGEDNALRDQLKIREKRKKAAKDKIDILIARANAFEKEGKYVEAKNTDAEVESLYNTWKQEAAVIERMAGLLKRQATIRTASVAAPKMFFENRPASEGIF